MARIKLLLFCKMIKNKEGNLKEKRKGPQDPLNSRLLVQTLKLL